MFDGFVNIFFLLFAGFIVMFVWLAGKLIYNSIAEKRYNDSQPVLTKNVKITGKRSAVSGERGDSSVSTAYYATFEFLENKQRLELQIGSADYGLMAENDLGKLAYQGRR